MADLMHRTITLRLESHLHVDERSVDAKIDWTMERMRSLVHPLSDVFQSVQGEVDDQIVFRMTASESYDGV